MSQYRNLIIEQGANFELYLYTADTYGYLIDLSNYSVKMFMKKSYLIKEYIPFTVEITDAIKGTLKVSMTAEETSELQPIRYVYDLILINEEDPENIVVTRMLEGIVTVNPSVTSV